MPYLTGQVLTEADLAALFASGTYTPTLGNMVIGTGGTPINSASYTFIGFPAGGVLTVEGVIKFGTAGTTLPAASAETVSLPSGYSMISTLTDADLISITTYFDVSAVLKYKGIVQRNSATTVVLKYATSSAPGIAVGDLTATVPFTWAVSDEIHYRFSCRCTGP